MPAINIREIDNTRAGAVALDDYSVFIPGNATVERITASENPIELNKVYTFTTLADFIETVGSYPVTYSDEQDKPYLDGNNKTQDVGYLTARMLLSRGMPVLYKVPCTFTIGLVDTTGVTPVEVEVPATTDAIVLEDTTYRVVLPQDIKAVTSTELVDEIDRTYVAYLNYTQYSGYKFYNEDGTVSITSLTSAQLGDFKTNNEVTVDGVTYTHFVFVANFYQGASSNDVTMAQITSYLEMKQVLSQAEFYEDLKDKGLYNPYFITTGGYFSLNTATKQGTVPSAMATIQALAKSRGDCVALVDHVWNANKNELLSIAERVPSEYSTMYTPWCNYEVDTYKLTFPASVAYLEAFANGTIDNPMWYAMAGAQGRGTISGTPIRSYGEAFANTLEPEVGVSINPITQINPYGVLIWGNRTLNNNNGLVASSFLNIRMLCCQLKKQLYISAKGQMFEQNSDRLWINFKSQVDAVLSNMVSGNGIRGYKINKLQANKKAQIRAHVRIVPIEALEEFDILLELSDDLTEVSLEG